MDEAMELELRSREKTEQKPSPPEGRIYFNNSNLFPPGTLARMDRVRCAKEFRRDYKYGSSTLSDGSNSSNIEKKTCVWRSMSLSTMPLVPTDFQGKRHTMSWHEESSGVSWVAVYAMQSICVVAKKEKLDKTRLSGSLKSKLEIIVLQDLMKNLCFEVEELAHPTSEFRRQLFALEQSTDLPSFGVVSVIPANEESAIKTYEEKVIKFLQKKLNTVSTLNEAIQTAISAFQRLFGRKFKDKEIVLTVQQGHRFVGSLYQRDVKGHLKIINGSRKSDFKKNTLL